MHLFEALLCAQHWTQQNWEYQDIFRYTPCSQCPCLLHKRLCLSFCGYHPHSGVRNLTWSAAADFQLGSWTLTSCFSSPFLSTPVFPSCSLLLDWPNTFQPWFWFPCLPSQTRPRQSVYGHATYIFTLLIWPSSFLSNLAKCFDWKSFWSGVM